MKKKIVLSLLVLVALLTITGCGKNEENNGGSGENNNAFSIKEGTNYAIFSDTGKKLTGFEFTYVGNFNNGVALVKNAKGESGVINTNGKMVIPFGKYKYVYQEASLFKVTDNDGNSFLISPKGKEITSLKNKTTSSFIGIDECLLLLDKDKNEYQLLDSNGDAIVKFAKGSSDDKPTTNKIKDFLSLYNEGKNYIIDLKNRKVALEFDSNEHYCINDVSSDGKTITLNSCVGMFQKQDEVKYKFIKDGKLYDLSDKCEKVLLNSENLVCVKEGYNYLLDSDFNVTIKIDGASYIDADHYAKHKDGSFNGIDFYEKDNVVKNVECRTMHDYGYSREGIYLLTTYFSTPCGTSSGTYDYYNAKGEKLFDKSFASAQKFDTNSLARVGDDKKNLYLIDTKGNKVTDEYDNIYLRSDYYIVTKNQLVGLLDNNGKVVLEPKYNQVDIFEQNGNKFAKLTTTDSKYIIYNVNSKKEVMTFDTAPSVSTHYVTITKDGKKQYYTYSGKLFYTEQ